MTGAVAGAVSWAVERAVMANHHSNDLSGRGKHSTATALRSLTFERCPDVMLEDAEESAALGEEASLTPALHLPGSFLRRRSHCSTPRT